MSESNQRRVHNRVALVTGAAGGMGASHARLLVQHGARVVVADTNEAAGTALAEELGEGAMFARLDVTSQDQWAEVVSVTRERFGVVDVLVNNAGILKQRDTVAAVSAADYRAVIEVNQVGTFLGMQAVIPGMIEQQSGSIINISSTAGMVAFSDNFAYAASKWAVRGMTKAAALQLARDGIRVNAILPGEVTTEMIQDLDIDVNLTPLGRFGTPQEISRLVLYLASDESSYTTGADHVIDGGYTLP